jgi:hypothetical protein
MVFIIGNVSSGNQSHRANYVNFNLNHTMLSQRRAHGRWEGWIAKVHLQIISPTSHEFCRSPLPPFISLSLDQHHVAQIEVPIVYTEGLFSTLYVPFIIFQPSHLISISPLHCHLYFFFCFVLVHYFNFGYPPTNLCCFWYYLPSITIYTFCVAMIMCSL